MPAHAAGRERLVEIVEPTRLERIESMTVDVAIVLGAKAKSRTLRVWLNGRDVSDRFVESNGEWLATPR